jgi:hypothetical protein
VADVLEGHQVGSARDLAGFVQQVGEQLLLCHSGTGDHLLDRQVAFAIAVPQAIRLVYGAVSSLTKEIVVPGAADPGHHGHCEECIPSSGTPEFFPNGAK